MLESLFQLFFPHQCAACATALHWHEKTLCLLCEQGLPFTDFFEIRNNRVEQTFLGRVDVTAASVLYFESKIVQPMLHALKYQKRTRVAELFGELMAEQIKSSNRFDDIDLIIPVPLHPRKEKLRGYNQSWIMTKTIAEALRVKAIKDLLVRTTYTETQTKKNRDARWQNVSSAFKVNSNKKIKASKILLIDDVITTGATAEACLQALKQLNPEKLFFASAATT